jgi:hypothetical protein
MARCGDGLRFREERTPGSIDGEMLKIHVRTRLPPGAEMDSLGGSTAGRVVAGSKPRALVQCCYE